MPSRFGCRQRRPQSNCRHGKRFAAKWERDRIEKDDVARQIITSFGDRSVQIGFMNAGWFDRQSIENALGAPVANYLENLPDGAELSLDFACPEQPATLQRYRGSINKGKWRIDFAHPPLDRQTLAGVLELAKREEKTKLDALDEDEADVLMEDVERDDFLHNMDVKRKGVTLSSEWSQGHLARLILSPALSPRLELRARSRTSGEGIQRAVRAKSPTAPRRGRGRSQTPGASRENASPSRRAQSLLAVGHE